MKKIFITLFLLFTFTLAFAQVDNKALLLARAKAEVVVEHKSWTETEYGILYLRALDELEQKYVGRLEGEIFKIQKAKLDKEYSIQELKGLEEVEKTVQKNEQRRF